jgi:hypothetical protein
VNQRHPGSFRGCWLDPEIGWSLAVIRKNPFTRRGELFPMSLKAGQHSEIALIQHRTAVPLGIAGASALLLFGSAVLCQGGTGKEKRESADDEHIFIHKNLFCATKGRVSTGRDLRQGGLRFATRLA